MSETVDIRLPEICGGTQTEQLAMVRSYLYTLAEQLQFAFDTVSREQQLLQERTAAKILPSQTPAATFGSIKSLIIKSSEIVDSFSQQIDRRLEGKYVSQSEFGTFTQETEQIISENSRNITQMFRDLQMISEGVDSVADALLEVNAYIRTGLLQYEEDEAVYGVEIGQQEQEGEAVTFHRFARLTAGKLSFYDENGMEVAYIGDYRLHITEAEVARLEVGELRAEKWSMGSYQWQASANGHLTLT